MKLFSRIKRLSGALLLLAFGVTHSFGQTIDTYLFATGTGGSITTLNSPVTLIAAGVDDASTAVTTFPGGFSFTYGGIAYTQFSISSNGLLNFGSTVCPNTYVNTIASVGSTIKITPFWDDIVTAGLGARYQILGTAPNRYAVFIWNATDYTTAAPVQFQMTLYETTNVIRFDYGAGSGGTANIGIDNSTTEFESVTVTSNTISTTIANNSVAWPGAGRYYTFTPVTIPSITSFAPTGGCASVTPVTITGTNFTGATVVKFGGVNAQSFTVNSASSITAIPSTGTTGTISVKNPSGTGTSTGSFTVNSLPTVSSTAAPSASVCGGTSVTLSGTGALTYLWSGGVTDGVSFIPTISGPYTVTGTTVNGCTGTASINISITPAPTTANAGADQTVCGTSATLAANTPSIGTGAWSIVSGTGGIITTASNASSTFTGTAGATYSLRWAISNSPCSVAADTVVIIFKQNPTTANAGADQTLCSTATTLTANAPVTGTGNWSIVSGTGGSFSNAALNNPYFTGVAGSSYTLRWSISNSPCTASTDDVVINFTANPTTANAGTDQAICGTSATLAANTPTIGTGTWSIVSGTGGIVTTSSSATSTFTGTAGSTYSLRWAISNSPCAVSADTVIINFKQNPTTANAGADQTICGTTVTLAANTPSIGTGAWSIVTGTGGIITTASNASSTFTGVAGSSYTLRWTISNGPCTASTDDVVINFTANPTIANAGSDQTVCGTTVTLAANTPSIGTGAWSIISGAGGIITTASNASSTFTGTAGATYSLRWAISNSPCAVSADTVVIIFKQNPAVASAGADQTLCSNATTLTANAPVTGTGNWSIVSGNGGSFSNAALNNPYFTGVAGSSYTLRWTISNSPCTASTDDVVINFTANPTVANAGADQTVCGTSATLAANTPSIGTGAWSIFSGTGGIITAASNSTSTFTGTAGASYTLRWTISNSPCTASTDDVVINFTANPTIANAGADQTVCGTSATLAANTPTIGTGAWSIVTGTGGIITAASNASSTFTGTAGATYSLRWAISNSPCTVSADTVIIIFKQNPTTANAGADQTLCSNATTLTANAPVAGTGNWSIVSGAGGSFSNAALNNPYFTGVAGSSYTLRWTISNSPCTASTDDVVINFTANPTIANAGADQTLCSNATTLTANAPVTGTGNWNIVSGTGGSFSNAALNNPYFTGVAGSSYTLRWTISNSPCPASTDDVVINFTANPTVANAGADQTVCGTTVTLAANTPTIGTGVWSIVSGAGGIITAASNSTSTFTGTAGSTYSLRWAISNSPCSASADTVVINFKQNPTAANTGADQTVCGTTATLSANVPVIGIGSWSIVSGNGGTIADPSNPASDFTGSGGITYTLRWSISNSPCNVSTDDMIIKFFNAPTANAGSDQSVCTYSSVTLNANIGGSANAATWTTSGNGTFSSGANNLNATYTPGGADIASGNAMLTLTTNNPSGVCVAATSQVNISINNLSNVNAGADREVCVTDTVQLNGQLNGAVVPILWTTTGDGVFDNNSSLQTVYRPGVADAANGWVTYILSTQPSSNVCSLVSDTVVFKVHASVPPQPSVITGAPISVCPPLNAINLSTASNPLATTYSWDISPGSNGITFVGTSTTNTQSLNLATTTNSGYNLRVTAYNACGASPYRAVYIRRATSVPVSVMGSIVACAGNTKTYTTYDVTGASTYKWTSTGGILLNGSTTPKIVPDTTIVATFPTNFNTGTICVSSQVACFTSATKCTTVSKTSPALNSLSGAANVCPGSAQTYKVPETAGAASYTWTLPANITGSSTNDSITVTIGQNFTTGSICVKATNVCGVVTAAKCQQVTSGVPVKPASITGLLAGVCGQAVTYTAPANPSTAFAWTVSSGAVINGPNNGNSINVTMPTPFSTAVVSVVAVNSCGNSLVRSITVKGAPPQPAAIISNPASFCANTQGVLFTTDSNTIMPGSNLLWTYPSTCTLVRGQGTTGLMLNWGSANGTVSLKASNACGNATRTFAVALASLRSANATSNDSTNNSISDPIIRTMQNNNPEKGLNLQAYPDMEQKILTFTFYAATPGEYTYSLLDESNREVRDGVIDAQEGVNMQEVEMNSLPANVVYRLKIKNNVTETHINVTMK